MVGGVAWQPTGATGRLDSGSTHRWPCKLAEADDARTDGRAGHETKISFNGTHATSLKPTLLRPAWALSAYFGIEAAPIADVVVEV